MKRGICSSPQKGSSFSVRRALKVYERCLQTWMAIHDGSFNPKEPCPDIEDDMVFIFKDLTQFLLESGHTELCFVLLVLMVEVNIRTLDCKSVADVEGFYRSGDPLLGEPGSAGWKAWSVKNERGGWVTTTAADGGSEDDDELEVDCEKSLAENWLSLEESRSLKLVFLPFSCLFSFFANRAVFVVAVSFRLSVKLQTSQYQCFEENFQVDNRFMFCR